MPAYTATVAAATTTTAVAAPATGFIEVWSLSVMSKGGNVVTFKSDTTAKFTVQCPTTDTGGICHPSGHEPIFQCAPGEALKITTSTTDSCAVNVNYASK